MTRRTSVTMAPDSDMETNILMNSLMFFQPPFKVLL